MSQTVAIRHKTENVLKQTTPASLENYVCFVAGWSEQAAHSP